MALDVTRLKGLLFDKDGTLFDFQATWGSWAATLLTDLFGPGADAMAARLGFDIAARRFAPDSPIIAETTDTIARIMLPELPGWELAGLVARMKGQAQQTALVEPVPLEPLVRGLAGRGLKLGIATNDDESSARRHLERSNVAASFGFVAGYDSGWGGKPAPGQMHAFLAWAGLAPGEAAMIGDSLHDLHAGRAAGMVTVGVLTGPATRAELAPAADVVLPDIGHLPDWLDGQAALAEPAGLS